MNKTSTLKNFQIINKLGEGSFSSVYKVRRYDNQLCYALKKVKIGQMCEKEKQNSLNEVRILASISNPHIINYKEAFFDDSSQTLCIVMELAEAGDILKKTNQHIKAHTYFKQAEIWKALIHMTKGLKALHDLNILHRDLKCANVFCTSDGVYKLGDLNVSKVAKKGMARTHTGTPYYTSPEVWKDKPYDSKCDIWSLGCVIYEMAALKPPFRANNLKQLYNKIQKGIFDRIPNFYSDDLHNLITNCMKVNPLQRPNTNQILINPIVIKNMLPTEIYKQQGPQQQNLLKTILVPKNLRALKQFLPSSNYENQLSQSLQKKVVDRISSVRGIGKIINIQTPKISERRYGYVQSPSKILRPESVNRSRDQLSANKKDYFEARKQKPQQSVELLKKQRDKSVELLRPYNLYNPSKQKQMIRNKSKEMLQEISSRKDSSKQKLKIIDNTRDRNLQLRRNHSQISRNVEKAVEAVRRLQTNESNKLILPVRRVADSSNKPRSQSFQKQNNRYNLRINPAIIKPENRYLNDKKQLPPRQLKL